MDKVADVAEREAVDHVADRARQNQRKGRELQAGKLPGVSEQIDQNPERDDRRQDAQQKRRRRAALQDAEGRADVLRVGEVKP